MAGFIEAEGTFVIRRQARGFGYQFAMSVNLRADDGRLLHELQRLTRLGRISGIPPRRTSQAQTQWSVTTKADCQRLTEILDMGQLRGRKGREYAVWRTAVHTWIGDDVTSRMKPDDWRPFDAWRRELIRLRSYVAPAPTDNPDNMPPGWRPYLAGFATGEGSFVIDARHQTRFAIHLRADDGALLRSFCGETGIGRIYGPMRPSGLARHPTFLWQTSSARDAIALVEIFDRHPPAGRKRLQYEAWRQAALERANGRGWGKARVAAARQLLRGYR